MPLETLVHPETQETTDEELDQIVSRIRDTVSNVPPERYDEIFSEFADAVDSGDINVLAETVANWAVRLPREKAPGEIVNRGLDKLPPLKDDPELYAVFQEYKAQNKDIE